MGTHSLFEALGLALLMFSNVLFWRVTKRQQRYVEELKGELARREVAEY